MVTNARSTQQEVFFDRLKDVLGLQQTAPLQGSDKLARLSGWDSLSILEFMSMADAAYKADLDPQTIALCQTVDDLAQLVLTPAL